MSAANDCYRCIGQKIGSEFDVTWSDRNVESPDGGQTIQLSLDYNSGSAIGTNKIYRYGYFSAQIKLVAGNSAGTLATFYLKTKDTSPVHDELDFEFLGNSSGQPYALQTNVFAANTLGREQRIFLWFDPTADFHQYSFLWNQHIIIFSVDSTIIRIFPNDNRLQVPYVYNPMRLYATIYNADDWVTQGGKVKIDWRNAPFKITLRDIKVEGCPVGEVTCSQGPSGGPSQGLWWDQPQFWSLSDSQMARLKYVQKHYMIYNYCTDTRRYPMLPAECINS
ncbi:unnamed protein product [Calypogeia fissa]